MNSRRMSIVLALSFALGLASLGCPGSVTDTRKPLARRDALDTRETWIPSEAECVECHDEVATQWASSRHHAAFTNVDFQRSFAREPTPFCRNCHAPALARLPEAEAEALGVGCFECHVDGDRLLASDSAESSESPHEAPHESPHEAPHEAPHALTRTADFATDTCGRCHEFEFPRGSWRPRGTMMQTTMVEHAASSFADRSCAGCHMPERDHGFGSTRDDAAIRRALRVVARREGDGLVVELEPNAVGHAFPTGDLFRRLELHAELVTPEGQTLAETTRYLGRHFEPRRHLDGRLNHAAQQPVRDDRIRAPTTIRLELDAKGREATLVWWLDYERVDHRDNHFPERSTIASEVRLAGGRL